MNNTTHPPNWIDLNDVNNQTKHFEFIMAHCHRIYKDIDKIQKIISQASENDKETKLNAFVLWLEREQEVMNENLNLDALKKHAKNAKLKKEAKKELDNCRSTLEFLINLNKKLIKNNIIAQYLYTEMYTTATNFKATRSGVAIALIYLEKNGIIKNLRVRVSDYAKKYGTNPANTLSRYDEFKDYQDTLTTGVTKHKKSVYGRLKALENALQILIDEANQIAIDSLKKDITRFKKVYSIG
ncbi:MAG TPA: hypothetical protein PKE30_08250 [Niabella sp.]|nr:hypothetical protein [Niabella sp.]